MKILLAWLIALSFAATISAADERPVPPAKPMLVNKGMLCDTQEQLQVLLTEISLAAGKMPKELPEGCGMFSPEQPIPMLLQPVEWYVTPMADVLITRFVHPPSHWVQWGWAGYVLNPDYIKPNDDEQL